MREVNFVREVVYGVAHLLDIDPTEDFLRDQARSYVAAITDKVREGWSVDEWTWPEFELTEERAFRQVWYDDLTYSAGLGERSELYYPPNQTYYRITGAPPAGTLPTDSDYFEVILPLDRHIAYEQYGKQAIDKFIAVHRFDPRTNRRPDQLDLSLSGAGVGLGFCTGPTVWVTYIPRPPEFTTETYSAGRAYRRGQLVLSLESGDCYRALRRSKGQPLTLAHLWLKQQFPYVLSQFVKYEAAASLCGDALARADFRTQAKEAIEQEILKVQDQAPKGRYRLFPRAQRHSLQPLTYA